MNGIGSNLTAIAGALISVALLTLLISHGRQTAGLITAAGSTFNNLLGIVTLQGNGGNLASMGALNPLAFNSLTSGAGIGL